ncbi:MAG: serine--tRNA ligase [Candidatus Goldiibacteriota bacterium HGW-Goldbacteria-1]|jgi:seryl-tRNA synthetase|nr:MAG: serine--tRNA ligase [Candidatus Goldiibacteriota bacterium HGW-Goldbacteria-1]
MLDIKLIRDNPAAVKASLAKKGVKPEAVDEVLAIDIKRREIIGTVEAIKAENNKKNPDIARLKKEGKDATALLAEMKTASDKIKTMDAELSKLDEELTLKLLYIPNMPDESVPLGADETANVETSQWGQKKSFSFKPKPHWEIAEHLGILDSERAVKVTGARFVFYKGAGARLERALINFMLDTQTGANGYTELLPPILVNRESMTGTGQLPKFEEDSFKLTNPDFFLTPTAEVPVTNIHRDEILAEKSLPICYAAYTPCFRKEAGSYGKDMKGIVRMHQFNKVELVKFTTPESSYDELEKLLKDAESILQKLDLHYRVMLLSTGDMTFSSAKTYDIEVWHEGAGRYWETSSCSCFTDYQARRARIRFKDKENKTRHVHTLNGSGLATSRLLPAILETYQTENMEVIIPEALRPYMGGMEKITK